jgi:multidrug resistance efflux pump
VFEAVSARPLSLIVFAGSVALLVWLQGSSLGRFQARAVAYARVVEHPALVASFVEKLFVQSGDQIEVGAPLADLSSYFVERELTRVDAEIAQLLHEAELAKARLMVEEERWLEMPLRSRPGQPSLARPTEKLYTAQLALLRTRRALLLEDRQNLTVTSHTSGRVSLVIPEGSPVAIGTSVATVTPEHAEEIIAYVPSDTEPATIAPGVRVVLASPRTLSCTGLGTVLRRGAAVAQAPDQVSGFLRFPVWGLPVYISVPEGCELGVGQLLTVEFPKATT